jgi:DDE superfamily endonuclease
MNTVTRLDYCQFLLVSQTNYTLTYFAEHSQGFSHDAVKRYLEEDKLTARLVWENVRGQVVRSESGYLAFDDTVLDHNSSFKIELVRRQYSGNAHDVIKGIGVVTCVYINPELDQFWVIDYRIYDPDGDGKTKLDHVRDMLNNAMSDKQLPFRGVLMDSWYAERKLMLHIERLNKVYYCPLKDNRQVDDSAEQSGYQRVDSLQWADSEAQHGKTLHIKDFPKDHQVKLFRLVLSTKRTDYIATNDFAQDSTQDTQDVCALRWKIEQFHRETKQTTGIEGCQCRLARIQRNHIACAILVWVRLKQVAQDTASTLYQLKHGLLDDYMRSQLRSPTIHMQFA